MGTPYFTHSAATDQLQQAVASERGSLHNALRCKWLNDAQLSQHSSLRSLADDCRDDLLQIEWSTTRGGGASHPHKPVPPQRASLLTKFYRVAKRRFGEVPEPFAVAAHHPRLMLANVVHEGMLGSASKKLPKNVLELAVFWTARTVGCLWCVDFGSMLQRLDGLDVDRLSPGRGG